MFEHENSLSDYLGTFVPYDALSLPYHFVRGQETYFFGPGLAAAMDFSRVFPRASDWPSRYARQLTTFVRVSVKFKIDNNFVYYSSIILVSLSDLGQHEPSCSFYVINLHCIHNAIADENRSRWSWTSKSRSSACR